MFILKMSYRMVIAPWKHENCKDGGEETVGYYRAWIRSIEGFTFCLNLNILI
jgi:hypothetical protein